MSRASKRIFNKKNNLTSTDEELMQLESENNKIDKKNTEENSSDSSKDKSQRTPLQKNLKDQNKLEEMSKGGSRGKTCRARSANNLPLVNSNENASVSTEKSGGKRREKFVNERNQSEYEKERNNRTRSELDKFLNPPPALRIIRKMIWNLTWRRTYLRKKKE